MHSGREDTLEERYTIKLCFKLGKNVTVTYGMLQTAFGASCMNWASVFEWHKRFKEGRESFRDDERCGRSTEVNTPELIGQRVGVRVTMLGLLCYYDIHALGSHWTDSQQGILCWGFKGVQEEIRSEEASTLEIGSVVFPPGQCTSQKLHPFHRLFDQDGHQDSCSPSV